MGRHDLFSPTTASYHRWRAQKISRASCASCSTNGAFLVFLRRFSAADDADALYIFGQHLGFIALWAVLALYFADTTVRYMRRRVDAETRPSFDLLFGVCRCGRV